MAKRPSVSTGSAEQVGVGGATPPPGAPLEVSQPLQPDAGSVAVFDRETQRPTGEVLSPLDKARQNERELAPLNFPKQGGVAEAVEAAKVGKLDPFYERLAAGAEDTPAPPKRISAASRLQRATGRPPVPGEATAAHATPDASTTETAADPVAPSSLADDAGAKPVLPPPIDLSTMPAASDTDSPARGIPRQPIRQGKEITGGFADQAAMQYFALTGVELKALVESLMDEVYARIQNDLRFNEALTYPQVSARVVIEVKGFAQDSGFIVDKFTPATADCVAKTPLEIARAVADEVCFVILAERREVDDEGQSVQPPDAMRVELGLPRPRKQVIASSSGRQMVDVVE